MRKNDGENRAVLRHRPVSLDEERTSELIIWSSAKSLPNFCQIFRTFVAEFSVATALLPLSQSTVPPRVGNGTIDPQDAPRQILLCHRTAHRRR